MYSTAGQSPHFFDEPVDDSGWSICDQTNSALVSSRLRSIGWSISDELTNNVINLHYFNIFSRNHDVEPLKNTDILKKRENIVFLEISINVILLRKC